MKTMKILVAWLVTGLLLSNCNPYSKLSKRPPKSERDTLALATSCNLYFPVTPRYDTVVKVDTVPDLSAVQGLTGEVARLLQDLSNCRDAKGNVINVDSIVFAVAERVRKDCTPRTVYQTREITKTVPDSAAIAKYRILSQQMEREKIACTGALEIKTKEADKYRKDLRRLKTTLWLIGIGFLVVALLVLYLKKKIPFL